MFFEWKGIEGPRWNFASCCFVVVIWYHTNLSCKGTINPGFVVRILLHTLCRKKTSSGTGTRTQVSCVKGKYDNHLHHTGINHWVKIKVFFFCF